MSADGNAKRPPRPCTEYNLFFQLERAYILQVHLHAQPSPEDTQELFHPSQPTYAGLPHLPERYASLALPYDWHLPGKEQRRKRKHRRSHGVISFQDLSLRIAEAWKKCDDVAIREYCAEVCKVGHVRYRKELTEWKASNFQNDGEKKKTEKKANKIKKQGRSAGAKLAEISDSFRPLATMVRRASVVSPPPSDSAHALERGVAPELDIQDEDILGMLFSQHKQDEEVEPALHLNMVRRASVVSPPPMSHDFGSAHALKRGVPSELDIMDEDILGMLFAQNHQEEEHEPALNLSSLTTIGDMVRFNQAQELQVQSTSVPSAASSFGATFAEIFYESRLYDEHPPLQERSPSLISNVDMDDDEILSMWKTTSDVAAPVPALVSRAPTQAWISNVSSNIMHASNNSNLVSSTNASHGPYHPPTFGPSPTMLEEVRKMSLLLEQQRVQLCELEKHTIVARSA